MKSILTILAGAFLFPGSALAAPQLLGEMEIMFLLERDTQVSGKNPSIDSIRRDSDTQITVFLRFDPASTKGMACTFNHIDGTWRITERRPCDLPKSSIIPAEPLEPLPPSDHASH